MFKRAFLTALLAVTTVGGIAQATECAEHFEGGIAPRIVDERVSTNTKEICYAQFSVLHSGRTRTALWSAEYLTKNRVGEARKLKRFEQFHEEERLNLTEKAYLKDYRGSGYDRGHLSPNGDFSSYDAQTESFSLANMIPQNGDNNRNLWQGIESATRTMVTRRGRLYVVTGPIFDGSSRMLNNRVMIPAKIYKAVYDPVTQEAGAYIARNTEGMDYETVSIAQLVLLTGIDVFPNIPARSKSQKMDLPSPTPHSQKNREQNGSEHKQYARKAADGPPIDVGHLLKTFSRFFR